NHWPRDSPWGDGRHAHGSAWAWRASDPLQTWPLKAVAIAPEFVPKPRRKSRSETRRIPKSRGFSRHLHQFHLRRSENSSTNRGRRDDRDSERASPAPFLRCVPMSIFALNACVRVGGSRRRQAVGAVK